MALSQWARIFFIFKNIAFSRKYCILIGLKLYPSIHLKSKCISGLYCWKNWKIYFLKGNYGWDETCNKPNLHKKKALVIIMHAYFYPLLTYGTTHRMAPTITWILRAPSRSMRSSEWCGPTKTVSPSTYIVAQKGTGSRNTSTKNSSRSFAR